MNHGERDEDGSPSGEETPVPANVSGHRSGYVAIVGPPNVGKSTLMNRLVHERLAIVTAKPQTTRRRTRGILSGDGWQMIFVDTPGMMSPKYELHRTMLRDANEALKDADIVLFLTEPVAPGEIPEPVRTTTTTRILVVNKIDTATHRDALIPVLDAWNSTSLFKEIIPISALHGNGVDELMKVLIALLPEGPPFYPPDQVADQPERFFVAEIIRERIFEMYEQEVPYAAEVSVQEFKERPGAKDFIEAWIHVEHDSQVGILIGKGGRSIRDLGEEAREEIEAFLGRPVYLTLRVKVLPRWRKRADLLRRLGYRGSKSDG